MTRFLQPALIASSAVLATALSSNTSFAYNWSSHSKMVETAVAIMADVAANPARPRPGLNRDAYWSTMLGSVDRLANLRPGLGRVRPQANCPTVNYNFDFSKSGDVRIREFNHCPQRNVNDSCLQSPAAAEVLPQCDSSTDVLSRILGWHAGSVDDHENDSVLWIRPTSVLLGGPAREYVNRGFELGLISVALPFYCLGRLVLSGDICDPDDVSDAVRSVNPLPYVDGWIPGIGEIKSADYVGLWHFIDLDSTSNRYNDVRGMLYDEAGPRLGGGPVPVPGAVDVGIMLASDLTGLSLNPGASDGDDRYQAGASVTRGKIKWQSPTIGHLEFSPLDNLALYGWNLFRSDPKVATGLGWPLHALGDAAEPHHVVGTTSWGHRPYEESVEENWSELIDFDDAAQRERILSLSNRWSQLLCPSGSCTNLPVQSLITALARETRQAVAAGDDWPYRDELSTEFFLGGTDLTSVARTQSILAYEDDVDRMRPLIENGIAAMVAFLSHASRSVVDPQLVDAACPAGTTYQPFLGKCEAQSTPPPKIQVCTVTGCAQSVDGSLVAVGGGGGGGGSGSGGASSTGGVIIPK